MILGLKVDVCTFDGLRIGVPNLLRLLGRHGVRASFFAAMGPDTTGRAVARALRPGFLAKMQRTRAIRTYGLRTILSGTLLPPRHMGRLISTLREVVTHGHELAIHGYDHRRWQDRLHRMNERRVRREMEQAMTVYRQVAGTAPRGFGGPGWQCNGTSLRLLDEMGFSYASDTRGTQPFFPCVAGQKLRTLQLPTTFPTFDEVLGVGGMEAEGFPALVCRELEGRAWSVLTIHAEMEGVAFQPMAERLLGMLGANGVACVPLEDLAHRIRQGGEELIPIAEVIPRPIRGRAGTVAMPAGFEVA